MEEIIKLLKRDWPKLLLLAVVFGFGIWLGGQLPKVNPKMAADLKEGALQKFAEIARWMNQLPAGTEFFVIWVNNINASLTAVLFGILLPVIPLFFLLSNGLLIGLFQNMLQVDNGFSPFHYYLSLVPHGILELPAFFIAVFLGIRFGLVPYRLVIHYLRTKEHLPLFKEVIHELRYYGVLIILMLLFAAVIEVSVSPLVIGLLNGR